MHIPNGFLDGKTILTTLAASGGFLAYAIKNSKQALKQKYIPVIGITAAFIFAAQMVNFPIAGGTSGHFMGAAFAVIIAGPFSGALVMALVIVLQSLIFQDGGITALGANVLNMAIIAPMSAYFVFNGISRLKKSKAFQLTAAFLAGFVSVVLGAIAVSLELAASGITSLRTTLPAMTGIHALIGLIEGLITVLALRAVTKLRPDIFLERQRIKPIFVSLTVLCIVTLVVLVPLASGLPDGLEKIAQEKGFSANALPNNFNTLLSSYQVPFLKGNLTTVAAGSLGALAILLIAYGSFLLIKGEG